MPRRKEPLRFLGSYQQLQAIVSITGSPGSWELMQAGYWRFMCRDGAILNWWPSTGTVNFQGPLAERQAFELALIDVAYPLKAQRPALPDLSGR